MSQCINMNNFLMIIKTMYHCHENDSLLRNYIVYGLFSFILFTKAHWPLIGSRRSVCVYLFQHVSWCWVSFGWSYQMKFPWWQHLGNGIQRCRVISKTYCTELIANKYKWYISEKLSDRNVGSVLLICQTCSMLCPLGYHRCSLLLQNNCFSVAMET